MFEIGVSMPKTVTFNFAVLPVAQAVRLPLLVHRRTRIVACNRGSIALGRNVRFGQVRIGFPHLTYPASDSALKITGTVTFLGECSLLTGIDLNVSGELTVGSGVRCGEGVKIDCTDRSVIGDQVIVGPKCYFADDDGHRLFDSDGALLNPSAGFRIGDRVWYGRECLTLKGVVIPHDVVVGAGSVVARGVAESGVVVAGNPAKVVKTGVRSRD